MSSMSPDPRRRRVVIGVDTHKHVHVAVALDDIGGRLDARSFPADRGGYEQLLDWAAGFEAKKPYLRVTKQPDKVAPVQG